jgi:hypothetical protein
MTAIRYLWAFPATCIGGVLGLACMALGAKARVVDGVLEVGGVFPRAGHFGAITFGHVIIGADDACLHACRAHEHVHVRQYERWGVLFFPLYAASSAWAWLRGGDAYRDNRFEREACASARAYPRFRARGTPR